jgi:ketosteroid isomerase-like protein
MGQDQNRSFAEELLAEIGRGAAADQIANLFSEDVRFEIAGDIGALPWIGRRTGRSAIADFISDTRRLIERMRFDVEEILTSDKRAVVVGKLASRIIATGRIIESDFALILTISNGKISGFNLIEDSFAVSLAARQPSLGD